MLQAEQGFYFIGYNNEGLKQKFLNLIGKETPRPQVVEIVMGRHLKVVMYQPLQMNFDNGMPFFLFYALKEEHGLILLLIIFFI